MSCDASVKTHNIVGSTALPFARSVNQLTVRKEVCAIRKLHIIIET